MSAAEQAFCQSLAWSRIARTRLLPWAIHGVPVGGEVVELGAGSGAMAVGMLTLHPAITYIATDIDRAMIHQTRDRLRAFGDRSRAIVGDATSSDFLLPASADVVCAFLMLHHTLDAEAIVSKASHILRPGGWFVGYDLADTRIARLIHRLDRSAYSLCDPTRVHAMLSAPSWSTARIDTAWHGHVFRFAAQRAVAAATP